MPIVRVRQRGQITLPRLVRDRAGLKEDTPVRVKLAGSKVVLEPLSYSAYPTREYTDEQIEQFLKDDKLSPALAKKVKKLLSA